MLAESRFETVSLAEIERMGLVPEITQHRPVVLVVNDEQIIADTRAAILRSWGYATITAYDAQSALTLADTIPPELLVTDTLLMGMNGVDLAIAIRMSVPDCKVILVGEQAGSADMLVAASNSGHDFALLDKPLHPIQLFAHLSKINPGQPSLEKRHLNRNGGRRLLRKVSERLAFE
jgi:DNA-binding NtrC family response regulator